MFVHMRKAVQRVWARTASVPHFHTCPLLPCPFGSRPSSGRPTAGCRGGAAGRPHRPCSMALLWVRARWAISAPHQGATAPCPPGLAGYLSTPEARDRKDRSLPDRGSPCPVLRPTHRAVRTSSASWEGSGQDTREPAWLRLSRQEGCSPRWGSYIRGHRWPDVQPGQGPLQSLESQQVGPQKSGVSGSAGPERRQL